MEQACENCERLSRHGSGLPKRKTLDPVGPGAASGRQADGTPTLGEPAFNDLLVTALPLRTAGPEIPLVQVDRFRCRTRSR
jgi:hypothetical protein